MVDIKQKTELNIKYEDREPKLEKSTRLESITGLFKTVSAVPTMAPRSIYEQVQLYVSGSTIRLYFYDTTNNSWRKLTDTTVNGGGGALEGDVVFAAGAGISLGQAGQTITITNTAPAP